MRRCRYVRDDEGASLVIVLAFVALFGVLLSVLLNQTSASFKRTVVTRAYVAKVYAADAGADAGIQALRNDDLACPTVSATASPLLSLSLNGTLPAALSRAPRSVSPATPWSRPTRRTRA